MKKSNFLWTWYFRGLSKTNRLMGISMLLLFVGVMQTFAASTYSQRTTVTLNLNGQSVAEVLDQIEKKSEFYFVYNENLIDVERKVDVNAQAKTVDEILEMVFAGENVDFKVEDRKVVLSLENVNEQVIQQEGKTITGSVSDNAGWPLPGVSVVVKGTTIGTITDAAGNFSLKLPAGAEAIVISFIGMETQEFLLEGRSVFHVVMQDLIAGLDEVVVVGYGTQKKLTLTAAVSQIDAEIFEDRPTANAFRSMQGTVPGLVISNSSSGGEPGAGADINIRGLITSSGTGTLSSAEPLVLVDGIEMSLNDVDPEDIESVSVLKDAAAASIYGSQAAAGAVIVTTKSNTSSDGNLKVNFSSSFSITQPSIWPESASPIEFAYAMNDARTNNFQNVYYTETDLANIISNMKNPGSAPTINSNATGTDWDYGTIGIEGTAATNWDDIIMKDWAQRIKSNINISGGTEKLNYYFSVGAYDEDGLLAVGDESYQRYNLDSKISSKVNDWLTIELFTKFRKSYTDYPIQAGTNSTSYRKSQVLDLITKLKPTLPQYDPIYGLELLQHSYYPFWDTQRIKTKNDQTVLLPRFIVEPIKGLKLNAQLNYKRDNNRQEESILASQKVVPNGLVDQVSQAETSYDATVITNDYFSPNIFATYDKSIQDHNFHATVGYQSELNKYYALGGSSDYLISNNVVSLNASLDDDQTVSEAISHWSTVGIFSRFRYNYKEKYLFEFSYRRDGSSRFEPGSQWAGFPSFSVGYNIAREDFWPLEAVSTFKARASYGTLGNQNVANYLYLSTISLNTAGTSYLFDGSRLTFAQTPSISSQNLTWETVKTTDIGFDLKAFNNKLDVAFSWYRTDVEDMAAQGVDLPAQLGTTAPLTNIGTSRVQGWEIEASWRQRISEDFSYSIRGVLSDYKRTMVEYPNNTKVLSSYFAGQNLGDIWGFETEGLFQTDEEATLVTTETDYSFITGWARVAGDIKYKDINGDNVIDRGEYRVGDTGDYKVIGNSTPRYQFSFNLGLTYKNLDFNALIQGVGKRDLSLATKQGFKGPANGPFHAYVWEGHLDYFRPEDTTSPLGPNTDAYFPAPYLNGGGRNNKNYSYSTDRLLQNAAYTRLKSVQIGYSLPKSLIDRLKLDKVRIYLTGENLLTFTDLMFFDPEVNTTGLTGSAQSYPLSRIISTGINVSF